MSLTERKGRDDTELIFVAGHEVREFTWMRAQVDFTRNPE
jgi:hypothetical protein